MPINIQTYGPFAASWDGLDGIDVRSAKLKALLVLLAMSPTGRRTRAWVQDMLWSLSGPEHGRASLRRALSDLRVILGDRFDEVFIVSNSDLQIRPNAITLVGSSEDGEFLEGLNIRAEGFEDWLRSQRLSDTDEVSLGNGSTGSARVRPAIAVIPFLCVHGDDREGGFGDLLAQELTRVLSRSRSLDIISHLSSRNLDQISLGLEQIGSALDVDYIVYGNVRTQDGKFCVAVDLASIGSRRILWTREATGSVLEFCHGDTEIVGDLAKSVGQAILSDSLELASCRPLPSVETHILFMSGIALMHKQALASFSRARACLEEVSKRVVNYSLVNAWLSKWYILSIQQGWSVNIEQDTKISQSYAKKALDINPDCSFSLSVSGFVSNNLLKKYDESMIQFEAALDIDPNNALAWLLKGTLLAFMDRGEEAVAHTQHARNLSPLDPHKYFYDSLSATAQLANKNYEAALELAEMSLTANRRHTSTLRVQTIALQSLGRGKEAIKSAEELCRREPTLTIERYLEKHPAANFETGKEWARALKEAGVPSH